MRKQAPSVITKPLAIFLRRQGWASPDEDSGRPRPLTSELRRGPTGMWPHVTVPALHVFGLLVVEQG
jgi:hypothetical protein